METIVAILHIIVCIELIVVVLLQAGKSSGGLGGIFGGGSQTVFGTQGGNVLTKITTASAIIFMVTSISLSYLSTKGESIVKDSKAVAMPQPASVPSQQKAAAKQAQPKTVQTQKTSEQQNKTATRKQDMNKQKATSKKSN